MGEGEVTPEEELKELKSFLYWLGCYRSYGAAKDAKEMIELIDSYYSSFNDANGCRTDEEIEANVAKAYAKLLDWGKKNDDGQTYS